MWGLIRSARPTPSPRVTLDRGACFSASRAYIRLMTTVAALAPMKAGLAGTAPRGAPDYVREPQAKSGGHGSPLWRAVTTPPRFLSAPKKKLGDLNFLHRLGDVLESLGRGGLEVLGLLDSTFNLLADECGLQFGEFGGRLNSN